MGKILAIDFGLKRIGLAISDENQKFAFGRPTLNVRHWQDSIIKIKTLSTEEGVQAIVVGWPKALAGSVSGPEGDLKKFINELSQQTSLPVDLLDERLTSQMADRLMRDMPGVSSKPKGKRDQLAATIILQNYLDQKALKS
ncbi:MAG: Holliday junction resolvase RuvX [Patescibacteria group bacterium]|nr:Holliday junction resolvase RuvX [Patescibacteria group bacterium]